MGRHSFGRERVDAVAVTFGHDVADRRDAAGDEEVVDRTGVVEGKVAAWKTSP